MSELEFSEIDYPGADSEVVEVEEVELEVVPPRRIATWLVVVFSLLIAVAYLVGNTVAVAGIIAFETFANPAFNMTEWSETADLDGIVVAACTLCSMLIAVPLMILCAYYQKEVSVWEYLALRKVSWRTCLRWVGVTLLLLACSDLLTIFIGEEVVGDFMRDVYTSCNGSPWLWVALIIAAPVTEECMFRGFMFTGLRTSALGNIGTAIVTSVLWALIHQQYGWYQIATIFVCGLLFSYVRVRTNSIVPCLFMHAAINLVAALEAAFVCS